MRQHQYKQYERIISYVVFLVSTVVYLFTMEKSASVWDNPEFITTFSKLEVGHPPGAPFYMLVYNFFSHLFPGHGDWVAIAGNTLSSILSGLTILILFRTISHLIRRSYGLKSTLNPEYELPRAEAYLGLGGALVGALMYAFSDTFWYSAIESEVYSFSSFFTALVFYLMLKWEETEDEEKADRWLLLIPYLMGLSVGVHLLNLLAIPAMALIYYFKKTALPTWKGALVSVLLSFVLIAVILFGVIQGAPEMAGWFDLFFVNTLGLPFNSGLAFYVLLLFLVLGATIWRAMSGKGAEKPLLVKGGFVLGVILLGIPFVGGWIVSLILLGVLLFYVFKSKVFTTKTIWLFSSSLLLIFMGISTYGVILIRANSDIPMNQNEPQDVFSLRYYLSREQYGATPLIYGQTYASLPKYGTDGQPVTTKTTTYKRDGDRYKEVVTEEIQYRDDQKMLFPRVYSNMLPHFKSGYEIWGNIKGETRTVNDRGESRTVVIPTFAENLRYFFAYQVNYMYWRYFMWNFSGRQNDLQGQGEITKGNWITGIPFIDAIFLGPQDGLPTFVKDNAGHNRYFMLPLILGLLGLLMQLYGGRRSKENFWIILLLFFMTGLAIVLYINQTPYQVRERDYAYAGSFYAFAIWVGFGVPALYNMLTKNGEEQKAKLAILISILCLGVPTLVLAENWDDHDRDGRRLASDFGRNYLESCAPDGIIFCNGDNDTFPLWYAQEVEGVRPDLQVCNTSYLQADWYINQMKRRHYDAAPLPISWGMKEYGGDKRGIAYIVPTVRDSIPVRTALDFIASDDPKLKEIPGVASGIDYVPTDRLFLKYDASKLIREGKLYPTDTAYIPEDEAMHFDFRGKNYLGKQEMIILDMLDKNGFERPMYYAITVGESEHVKMTDYMRMTGMAFQILPFRTRGTKAEIDTKRMYENVTKKFRWGGADTEGVYMDENNRNMCETYRSQIFGKLAQALIEEGDTVRAKEVLALSEKAIRSDVVPHSSSSLLLVDCFYKVGEKEKAEEISRQILDDKLTDLDWYYRLDADKFLLTAKEMELATIVSSELLRMNEEAKGSLSKVYGEKVNYYTDAYMKFAGALDEKAQ